MKDNDKLKVVRDYTILLQKLLRPGTSMEVIYDTCGDLLDTINDLLEEGEEYPKICPECKETGLVQVGFYSERCEYCQT